MPTLLGHGLFAVCLARIFHHPRLPRRFWLLAIVCAILPDIDIIGFALGIEYGSFWGHRGFTHSLFFAGLVGFVVTWLGFYSSLYAAIRWRLWIFYFLVTASHGIFDALTNGGLGIAFFAPFDNTRYFFPITPIAVSPIGFSAFLKWGGMRVLGSELLWIGLPSVSLVAIWWLIQQVKRKKAAN